MITQALALSLLEYSPETGALLWKVARGPCSAGVEAGHIDKGYRWVTIDDHKYPAHRLIWFMQTGKWPERQVDHKNRKTLDNRWENLREATNQQNQQNKGLNKNNGTGVKGVSLDKKRKQYYAYIRVDGTLINLGRRGSLEDATELRREAEEKYHSHRVKAW